ncbi:hypothetical protein O181_104738, partial [Austropuccinia psidii MF-1]|nr:hypothetical protein [Austropuccinia psidii MF-1]
CHSRKKEKSVKGNSRESVGLRKESNIGFSRFRLCQCQVDSNREVKGCVPNIAPWALGTILDSKPLSFKWKEELSDILSASTHSNPSTTRE